MTPPATATFERDQLLRSYHDVRATTESLCEPLTPEDMVVQTMPDVSPAKWHLGHVTWFFETFVLTAYAASYETFDPRFRALFNSYYESVGGAHPRARRGYLSRPTLEEVLAYRRHVDGAVTALLEGASEEILERVAPIVEVGMHHEQQHQELLLMDVKHVLGTNPLRPAYKTSPAATHAPESPLRWHSYKGGRVEVGLSGDGFAYDNEGPRHTTLLAPFELATRLVTCADYLAFMRDGGYERHDLWLADGWELVQRERWRAPLYWEEADDGWRVMTLGGLRDVAPREPVCHVSYYEADACARWAGCRLPTEFEWERAAQGQALSGVSLESGSYHPRPLDRSPDDGQVAQLFGDVWEWTASPYTPYPGYEPFEGALGEYNGRFMVNQIVLRGGSCVTPRRHLRRTYRNFYYPHQRWMFSGFRLAK